jgi:predicted  nucleic acid-binding Zn-ribbon protein
MLSLQDENQRLVQQASVQMRCDGSLQFSNNGKNPRETEFEL